MRKRLLFLIAILLIASSCAGRMGPRTIPRARFNYNQTISRSQNDQLLLNLVRLRYRDTPVFLDVGTVIAQYTVSARAGASPTVNIDGTDETQFGFDLGGSYSEQPTITYEPLKGSEFTQRLLTPLSPVTIILLSESGWSVERLLLCCVERINRITNAPTASGPTPSSVPDNKRFRELARLFRQLQVADALDFQLAIEDDRRTMQIRIERPRPEGPNFATLQRVRELLDLSDEREIFRLTTRGFQRAPGEIALVGRSLLGALFFLSHAVAAPSSHEQRGLVTVSQTAAGDRLDWNAVTGGLLKIASSASTPATAFVRVRYRDHWFYIEDSDLHSKATFNLLTYLFSLQAAGEGGVGPMLTVPVGR